MDLPDELALPLERGAPWWYWLGGRPALDFVNTLRERWRRRVETLVVPEDLAEWLVAAGVLGGSPRATADHLARALRPTADHLERARSLREAIDAAVVAVIDGRRVPDESVAAIGAALKEAVVDDELVRATDGSLVLRPAAPRDPVAHGLGLVARDAAAMLGPDQVGRIRVCGSETCSARFYDRSPAGRRRWCSMRACGNVEKARRHRRRAREERHG